jgi:predicted O-methyltransferase YrrM
MKFEIAASRLKGIPFISGENARYLYKLVSEEDVFDILELGIAHGTASCYMAAALQEKGRGSVTAVDLVAAADAYDPSAEAQVHQLGFDDLVKVVRMETGYTWFLHDEIRRNTVDGACREVYDLCIIDGPKNWTIDGAAFFMADKLLKQGGLLIFDDYDWTYAHVSKEREATDGITHRSLSDSEFRTPQIREVFELLVRQHPNYSDFTVLNADWAIARKIKSEVKHYKVIESSEEHYNDIVAKLYYKTKRNILRR